MLGTVAPGTGHVKGTVTVFARAVGKRGRVQEGRDRTPGLEPGQLRDLGAARSGQLERQGEVPGSRSRWSSPRPRERSRSRSAPSRPRASPSARSSRTAKGSRSSAKATPSGESGAKVELLRLNTAAGRAGSVHRVRYRAARRREEQGDVPRQAQVARPLGAATRVRPPGRGTELLGLENGHHPLGP